MANRTKITEGLYRQETRQGPSFICKFRWQGKQYSVQLKDEYSGLPIRDDGLATAIWDAGQERIKRGLYPFEESVTIDQWLKDYLAYWKPRNAESTHADKTFRLGYWRKWMNQHHPMVRLLSDLRREHFERYQTRPGLKPKTVNLDFRYLRHALSWAVEREWLERSPIERLKRLKEPTEPRKTLSPDTVSKVAAKLPPVARAAWWFCAETGVRPGEMFALQWSQLDFAERKATILQTKTNKLKTVWFSKETGKLIQAIAPAKGGHVFYSSKGAPFNRTSWRETVYRAATAAKLMAWGPREGTKKPNVILWGTPPNPYALRHTATSAMLETEDVATVRDAVGHSSIAVTNIYAHSSPERIKAAFERLHKRKKSG